VCVCVCACVCVFGGGGDTSEVVGRCKYMKNVSYVRLQENVTGYREFCGNKT
jgi:hypothetical protein